jgi:hypothetical protein
MDTSLGTETVETTGEDWIEEELQEAEEGVEYEEDRLIN